MSTESCSCSCSCSREKIKSAITIACYVGAYVSLVALACWAETKNPGCFARAEKERAKREYERKIAEIDRKYGYA